MIIVQRESKRQARFAFRGEGVEWCHEQTNVDFPTDLQRLRKLVGYLKLTANVCVVLDAPEPGQGKWKNSDKFWVLESFSDSDWSSNQTHRRSTSCGIHMLNGVYLFGSSKSQRVVSLSSCEAELHALVSTFCDGIFLRRCLQFLTGAVIDHFLFTDSSSARQLAMRQGTEKVKHLSGKILWVQQWVMEGKIVLIQIPTLWNLADLGTKSLGGQRIKLLLHELNVAHGDGSELVGQEEYDQQCNRHSGGKQLTKLAKSIARILLVAGLESGTSSRGVGAVTVLDDDDFSGMREHCLKEPNDAIQQSDGFPWWMIFGFITKASVS